MMTEAEEPASRSMEVMTRRIASDGLAQIVDGAELHRLDGLGNLSLAGNDDGGQIHAHLLDVLQDREPIALGHFEVTQKDVRREGADQIQRLVAIFGDG